MDHRRRRHRVAVHPAGGCLAWGCPAAGRWAGEWTPTADPTDRPTGAAQRMDGARRTASCRGCYRAQPAGVRGAGQAGGRRGWDRQRWDPREEPGCRDAGGHRPAVHRDAERSARVAARKGRTAAAARVRRRPRPDGERRVQTSARPPPGKPAPAGTRATAPGSLDQTGRRDQAAREPDADRAAAPDQDGAARSDGHRCPAVPDGRWSGPGRWVCRRRGTLPSTCGRRVPRQWTKRTSRTHRDP